MAKLSENWHPKIEVRFSLTQALEIYKEFREVFCKDQPLPKLEEISKEGRERLDGCLGSIAQQTLEGEYYYRSGIETLAAYFYFVNKSHWLLNGNKRSAIIFSIAYLKVHNKWLRMGWIELYNLAKKTAVFQGRPEKMLKQIRSVFQKSLIGYHEGLFTELITSWEDWLTKS